MNASVSNTALLKTVIAWRDQTPKPDLRGLPVVTVPVLGRLRKAIPRLVGKRTLATVYATSLRLSQPQSLLREAAADSLATQGRQALDRCDALARRTARQSGWLAGSSGALLGVAGAAGLIADAPALLLIAMRTLMRIGYCYGEAPSPALIAALLALASADGEEEKQQAWHAALIVDNGRHEQSPKAGPPLQEAALRDGLERAAEREFAKQALTGSLQKLSSTLVQRMGMRKMAGALPVIGALVGGAVNIRFVVLLGEAARMVFVARRLLADGVSIETLLRREALTPMPVESAAPAKPVRGAKSAAKRTPAAPARKASAPKAPSAKRVARKRAPKRAPTREH